MSEEKNTKVKVEDEVKKFQPESQPQPEPQPSNMETHAQHHIPGKKWTHYFREFLLLVFAFCFFISVQSQPLPDSVITHYNNTHRQKDKGKYLLDFLRNVVANDSNDVKKSLEILGYFNKQKDEAAADYTELFIAGRLNRRGDYSTGLTMALSLLPGCEKRKDTIGIVYSFKIISDCFDFARNFEEAVAWRKKAIPVITAMNDEDELADTYNDIGAIYARAVMPDSGLVYAQKAVNIDTKTNNESNLVYSLGTLGENYMASKDFDLALPFLRKSLGYASSNTSPWAIAYAYSDFAQAFLGLKQYDSAQYYAHKAIQLSNYMGFKEPLIKSYEYLYKSFEASGGQDSVNKYFRLAMAAKDSVYSTEKTQNIQAIGFREQLSQQEKENEKAKAEEERKTNIQYAAIAIGLISFIILFFSLSQSIIVKEKFIKFFGILGLLAVFEFINLYIHPYLVHLTDDSPVFMLAILMLIAALLIPLHHRLEKWITKIMVEKNKKIRLEAAKKTIAKLEGESK